MYGDFFYTLHVIMNNNVVGIVQEIKNDIAYFEMIRIVEYFKKMDIPCEYCEDEELLNAL